MDELWRLLRRPEVSTVLVLGVVVLGGLALLGLGYRGVAAQVYAPAQLPYVASGSLLGIAALGAGLRLLSIHVDRVEAATERRLLAAVQRDALLLVSSELSQGEDRP